MMYGPEGGQGGYANIRNVELRAGNRVVEDVVTMEKVLFSISDYHKMAEAGILSEGDRVELIEGEIVRMNPIGSRHAACVRRIDALFNREDLDAIVSVQSPVLLPDLSEPEPDVALLRPRGDFYSAGHPEPGDVLLLIEVSDTTLDYDRRNPKLPLYARFGIPETWIVDLSSDTVEAHSRPAGGVYEDITRIERGESLSPKAVPNLKLGAHAILP